MRGAHWIAIDTTGGNLGAPTPLDSVVDADDQRAVGQEPLEDLCQQLAGNGPAVPARSAEYMVAGCEIAGLCQSHDAQCSAHRALARGEHSTSNQHQDMVPDRRSEEASEGLHQ